MDPFVDLLPARRPANVILEYERQGTEARLAFSLPLSSGWFDGHFPDLPILPGVTQVHLAALAATRVFELGIAAPDDSPDSALQIVGTRRLKFQSQVHPAMPLELELTADARPPTRVRFSLRLPAGNASSGTMIIGPRARNLR